MKTGICPICGRPKRGPKPVPTKFATTLARFPHAHEVEAPEGIQPVVERVADPGQLLRFLADFDPTKIFLTYTRQSVTINRI